MLQPLACAPDFKRWIPRFVLSADTFGTPVHFFSAWTWLALNKVLGAFSSLHT